ncbi:MAG: ethanolamine ammonia-lyase subunit EutC [Candidatus Dactylopiibacterium sp.]|nr:ethanolamine ammonia-lyase subunit EutC [Candidatus Dactylopiibacterium sp.]
MKPARTPPDPWVTLRRFTAARIALGRTGVSLPTHAQLAFQAAHAAARDAVHATTDWGALARALDDLGLTSLRLTSAAATRSVYLQRPDLGRRLDAPSRERLAGHAAALNAAPLEQLADGRPVRHDLAIVIADGLSAFAIERQAAPLLAHCVPALREAGWRIAPVALVEQGRVAIGDEIGAAFEAAIVLVLIGERPGLSSPDSLGLYFTHAPRAGLTDAARNCISNVRPEGFAPALAARRLDALLRESRRRRLSGVALKDETPADAALGGTAHSFLTSD